MPKRKKRAMAFVSISILVVITLAILASAVYFEVLIKNSQPNQNPVQVVSSNVQAQPSTPASGSSPPPQPSAPTTSQTPSSQATQKPTAQAYADFEKILAENPMIQDLPENAAILLRFYNYNSAGQMAWQNSYILRRASVTKGTITNADIELWLPTTYISKLSGNNLCDVVQQAKANEELSIRTSLSKASLLWKFRSMLSYRDCLGF